MTQTKAGSLKTEVTTLKRYGLTEDGKNKVRSEAGRKGGSNGHGGGFAKNKKLARSAGKAGGLASGISRRAKIKSTESI